MTFSLKESIYNAKKKITQPYKTVCEMCEYKDYKYASLIPDKMFLKCFYRKHLNKKLNLKNPQTYNEKLQWLKLYDRKPIYTTMVDKAAAKEYVANILGEEYIITTLGIWNSPDDIEFDRLPNQFVLKTTHDSGGVVICKDKSHFDIKNAKEKLNGLLKKKAFYYGREWPYKNVIPRVIAEEYISDSHGELNDYKFFCFDGKAKALFVATDRFTDTKFDFFDLDFNHLPIVNGHPNADREFVKPNDFEKMIKIAEKLSVGIPHVRVDLYNIESKIYFGELTFSHYSGIVPFEPEKWDNIFGEWLKKKKKKTRG